MHYKLANTYVDQNSNFFPCAAATFVEISQLMATGYYLRISFKERTECDGKKGYINRAHCNDFVSRSTFKRHGLKRNETNLTDTFGATSNSRDFFYEISSSSNDEG